jgi:hypothetical protein
MPTQPEREKSDPSLWLGDTPMLNLGDDKLRLRVQTVTQFSVTDADKLKSICAYVASIPFDVPAFAAPKHSRRTLARREAVGWYSKAALFQAMLRTAGFPARVRMIRVGAAMFRGLAETQRSFVLPVVEVWTGGKWIATDNYVYDPRYLAAAREALYRRGWRSGYGIHLDGQDTWNGVDDAIIMIVPDRSGSGRPPEYLGVYEDPHEFAQLLKQASTVRWLTMLVRNRIMSIRLSRKVRQLRNGGGG